MGKDRYDSSDDTWARDHSSRRKKSTRNERQSSRSGSPEPRNWRRTHDDRRRHDSRYISSTARDVEAGHRSDRARVDSPSNDYRAPDAPPRSGGEVSQSDKNGVSSRCSADNGLDHVSRHGVEERHSRERDWDKLKRSRRRSYSRDTQVNRVMREHTDRRGRSLTRSSSPSSSDSSLDSDSSEDSHRPSKRSRHRSRSPGRKHRERHSSKRKDNEKGRGRYRSRERSTSRERRKRRKEKSDRDKVERRSALTGKKIKLKVKKDKGDHERDANRRDLLQFLNSTFE